MQRIVSFRRANFSERPDELEILTLMSLVTDARGTSICYRVTLAANATIQNRRTRITNNTCATSLVSGGYSYRSDLLKNCTGVALLSPNGTVARLF
jgi:hypothetical protein